MITFRKIEGTVVNIHSYLGDLPKNVAESVGHFCTLSKNQLHYFPMHGSFHRLSEKQGVG